MPITYTPLRFPGGKSKIYPFVNSLIETNNLQGCTYAEAFCGGAGLAMKLLLKGNVARVVLNDIDPAIYSIWDAIVNHSDDLCNYIKTVPLNIEQWLICQEIYRTSRKPSLELGKAAFYLNRTNRSGILAGGVIGGKTQAGTYKLDARFNRDSLCKKVRSISKRSADIRLYNLDAIDLIEVASSDLDNHSILYLDPPYVQKGPGLYENCFTEIDHKVLSEKIRQYNGNWIVTYDIDDLIDQLYLPSEDWDITISKIEIGYSASSTRKVATERLILGPGVRMPAASSGNGQKSG